MQTHFSLETSHALGTREPNGNCSSNRYIFHVRRNSNDEKQQRKTLKKRNQIDEVAYVTIHRKRAVFCQCCTNWRDERKSYTGWISVALADLNFSLTESTSEEIKEKTRADKSIGRVNAFIDEIRRKQRTKRDGCVIEINGKYGRKRAEKNKRCSGISPTLEVGSMTSTAFFVTSFADKSYAEHVTLSRDHKRPWATNDCEEFDNGNAARRRRWLLV